MVEITEDDEIQLVQKIRWNKERDSALNIFIEQGRQDLADPELHKLRLWAVCPEQLTEEEVERK